MATVAPKSRSVVDMLLPRAQAAEPATSDYWYEARGKVNAGQVVTGRTALTYSGSWAATNLIAGLFGALPCKVYKKTADGRNEADKHPNSRILGSEPNSQMDSFVFWEMMTQWWVNYGNGFAEKQKLSVSGDMHALWPIHPSRCKKEMYGDRWTGRWRIISNGDKDYYLEDDEIFNLVGHLSDDGKVGKGIVTYASQVIGVGLAQEQYQADFYGNGGRPSGTLEHPSKLSATARDDLRREWREVHGKSNEVAVLWEGMKFNPVSVDPEHAQLMESKLGTIQDICRFYDLPPHTLYELSKGTFANTEEMNRFLLSQPFFKRLVRVEKACNRQLFSEAEKQAGYYVKFNIAALLRGTPKEAAEVREIELRNGVISPDEWRESVERNKLPDGLGDNYFMRRDMATIDLVIEGPADVETSTPISTSPDTPGTPGTPDQSARIRSLKKRNSTLRTRLETALAESANLDKGAEASHEALADMRRQLCADKDAFETLSSRYASLDNDLAEQKRAHEADSEASKEREDALRQQITRATEQEASARETAEQATARAAEIEGQHTALQTRFVALEVEHAEAIRQRDQSRGQLITLAQQQESSAKARASLENELQTAREALSKAESQQLQDKTTLESMQTRVMAAGNSRARLDEMATELGTLRAQCGTLSTQVEAITRGRDEAIAAHAESRRGLETSQKRVDALDAQLETAKTDAETVARDTRLALSATIRELLETSLASLLDKERHEVRTAARKPEQFKQICSDWYHHFGQQLSAQLKRADDALVALGAERTDTAKMAADYVSESRQKLNIKFNATPRADLRSAIREETESWEGRDRQLLNWIGE